MSATIKAAYNFVPLAKNVFYPKWRNQVSLDTPFSDQVSGEITLKITAETKIFIRNSSVDINSVNDFSHICIGKEKKYFIPGSSIKGVIRSVLEIMSFGKISVPDNNITKSVYRKRVNYGNPLESVKNYIDNYGETYPDLPSLIFGYTNIGNKSLKGRVHFSHAFASPNTINIAKEVYYTLASPKPSFLPNYMVDRKMYSNIGSIISGWKRYLLKPVYDGNNKYNGKTDSALKPINAGATFECKVHYHNLKPVELQALISAITFHYNDSCYHQIGQGKGYGFGRIKIDIVNFNKERTPLTDYENVMDSFIGKGKDGWKNSEQIKELSLMASTINQGKEFQYMTLKEHQNAFNDTRCVLHRFSDILSKGNTPISINNDRPAPKKYNSIKVEGFLNTDPRFSTKGDSRIWIELNKTYRGYVPHGGCFVINGEQRDEKASFNIKGKKIDDYKKKQVDIKITQISSDRKHITVEIIIK